MQKSLFTLIHLYLYMFQAMIKQCIKAAFIASTIILAGCASGLNSLQEREYNIWQQEGLLIKEKNPNTGAVLGFLPGGGSFYAREPALGILNLVTWPLSIFWDPVSGHRGSMVINYELTRYQIKQDKHKEMTQLEDRMILGEISKAQYLVEKRRIDEKYPI